MSDEKRQTRLLPFRLGRAGARRAGAGGRDAEDFGADAELTALLRAWDAPPPSDGARARLLADFRATVRPAPLWRRALTAHVRVPLPVAACAVVALLLSPLAFGARPWRPTEPATATATSAEVAPAERVRVVEVPVVQERVVTRTVYVEKKERGLARVVSPQPDGVGARPEAPETASAKPAETRGQEAETPAPPDASAGYFSRVNMEDFQPADEMKIRVVKRGGVDEK